MTDIGQQVAETRRRIAAAATRAGRDPAEVTLMAVTKTVPPSRIQEAVDAGVRVLGENRVQEGEEKIPAVQGDVEWHLVGHLQSNKARLAAALFAAVHSVDRTSLVPRLDVAAADRDRVLPVYVQVEWVRTDETEEQVSERTRAVCVAVRDAEALLLAGLMTLPPFDPDPETARPWFRRLRRLRDDIAEDLGTGIPGLSMGMSNDFEVAVEEGATIIRVGSTIFGARA